MIRPKCKCGNLRKVKYENGKMFIGRYCNACYRAKSNHSNSDLSYRQHKKDYCELCGFIAVHSSQLDVDHIDGKRDNNDPINLQTLCANCHRLKTWQNKDFVYHLLDEPNNQLVLFEDSI